MPFWSFMQRVNWKEESKKNGVEYKEFNNGSHIRFIGGLTVDYWVNTKRAWIFGTDKAFKVIEIKEIFDVANCKKFPVGVKFTKKGKSHMTTEFMNIDLLCPVCRKDVRPHQKSIYDQMISE